MICLRHNRTLYDIKEVTTHSCPVTEPLVLIQKHMMTRIVSLHLTDLKLLRKKVMNAVFPKYKKGGYIEKIFSKKNFLVKPTHSKEYACTFKTEVLP